MLRFGTNSVLRPCRLSQGCEQVVETPLVAILDGAVPVDFPIPQAPFEKDGHVGLGEGQGVIERHSGSSTRPAWGFRIAVLLKRNSGFNVGATPCGRPGHAGPGAYSGSPARRSPSRSVLRQAGFLMLGS
jgi:hypothetical protein